MVATPIASPEQPLDYQLGQCDEIKSQGENDPTSQERTQIASNGTISNPELPPLPYSLRDHKLSIGIIWTLLLFDAAVLPIVLFYPLWYATDEQPWVVITITTCVFGVISGAEWIYRTWKLWKDESVRPLGSRSRWQFDFFHISYTLGYGIALVWLHAT